MKAKGSRRISFEQFLTGLAVVADSKKAALETIVSEVCASPQETQDYLNTYRRVGVRSGDFAILPTPDTGCRVEYFDSSPTCSH